MKIFKSKIEGITYNVVLFWIVLGILGIIFTTNFFDLSTYFIALTGFIGSYIFSEVKRQSQSTSVFYKGHTSRRELMAYIVTYLWFAVGVLGVVNGVNLVELAAYFASVSTFAGSYVVGKTYKPKDIEIKKVGGVGSTPVVDSDEDLAESKEP